MRIVDKVIDHITNRVLDSMAARQQRIQAEFNHSGIPWDNEAQMWVARGPAR